MRLPVAGGLVVLAGLVLPSGAGAEPCRQAQLQGRAVTLCSLDMARGTVRLYHKDTAGTPFGSLSGVAERLQPQPGRLLFAMNAGMYHQDLSPVGLYIENGVQRAPANTARGPGNFHLLPNGVFHVRGRAAGVSETRAFLRSGGRADFATQSGPMLVIDGRLHPKITGEGRSAKIRNGVGVSGSNVHFLISDEPVTFSEFARMFRDDLKCRNALYFDGSISSLYAPSVGRADRFLPVGPIVAGFQR